MSFAASGFFDVVWDLAVVWSWALMYVLGVLVLRWVKRRVTEVRSS